MEIGWVCREGKALCIIYPTIGHTSLQSLWERGVTDSDLMASGVAEAEDKGVILATEGEWIDRLGVVSFTLRSDRSGEDATRTLFCFVSDRERELLR